MHVNAFNEGVLEACSRKISVEFNAAARAILLEDGIRP
jgi:hypothetical protein